MNDKNWKVYKSYDKSFGFIEIQIRVFQSASSGFDLLSILEL